MNPAACAVVNIIVIAVCGFFGTESYRRGFALSAFINVWAVAFNGLSLLSNILRL